MRSRLWLGGVNAEPRRGGKVGVAAVKALQRVRGPDATLAEALVVHCSQEMSQLAGLLPATYAELGNDWAFGIAHPRDVVSLGGRPFGIRGNPAHGQVL